MGGIMLEKRISQENIEVGLRLKKTREKMRLTHEEFAKEKTTLKQYPVKN